MSPKTTSVSSVLKPMPPTGFVSISRAVPVRISPSALIRGGPPGPFANANPYGWRPNQGVYCALWRSIPWILPVGAVRGKCCVLLATFRRNCCAIGIPIISRAAKGRIYWRLMLLGPFLERNIRSFRRLIVLSTRSATTPPLLPVRFIRMSSLLCLFMICFRLFGISPLGFGFFTV